MAQYFFESQDDFHYDNSGYYGYIVFNGVERTRNNLLQALGQGRQEHGLGWYRYGKSFRPANDGNMYDWYVRLHSGGQEKPAPQAVDDFLRRHLQPPKIDPAPSPSAQRPSEPLARDLRQLQSDIAREKDAHREAYDAQQRLATLLGSLQGIDTRISDDLEQLRLDLQEIAETWRGDRWGELNLGSIVHALDSVNERLTRDLTRLQRDYSDISSAHADTLRAQDELAQVLERIKDHDRHISDDLARLQKDVQQLAERENQDGAGQGQAELLGRFDELERRLGERIGELSEAVAAGTAAREQMEELRAEMQERQEKVQEELDEKDQQIDGLNEQLSSTDQSAEIVKLNADVTRLRQKVTSQEGLIRKHKSDLAKLRDKNRGLEQKLGDANRKKDEWEDKYHKLKSEKDSVPEPEDETFEATVRTLSPHLFLIRGTTDIVRHEFEHDKPVLELLRRIVLIKGFNGRNKIANTKWRESHVGNTDWRMYFCKETRLMKGNIVAFLSDKNSQEDDIRWMQAHSPDSCI